MNLKKFLFMSLCLVLGALTLWRYEREHPTVEDESTAQLEVFPGVSVDAVQKLSVVRAGSSYSVVRQDGAGGRWEMRRPEGAPADSERIVSMIGSLTKLRSQNVLERADVEGDQSIYGLQPPELVLTVEGTFGKRVVSFGKKLAISGRRYLQPEADGRIFLIDEPFYSLFNIAPEDIRDRTPLKFDPAKITEWSVTRPNGDTVTFKKDTEGWLLQAGELSFRADAALLEEELREIRKVRAKEFIDDPGEALLLYGFAKPKIIIELRGAGVLNTDGQVLSIKVGEGVALDAAQQDGVPGLTAGTGYYLQLGDDQRFIYRLERPFYSELLQPPEFFRPRRPFAELELSSVERIEMEQEGSASKSIAMPHDKLASWLKELSELRVLSYGALKDAGNPETGLQKPSVRYRVFVKDRPQPLLIILGSALRSNGASETESSQAPRWIAVTQQDGALIPAIVDAESFEGLHHGRQYFNGQ